MSEEVIVSAQCDACGGTGLYVGLAEQRGVAVVCSRCDGTGEMTVRFVPFGGRQAPDRRIRSVHLSRGYGLAHGHPLCDGGMPVEEWMPGVPVPGDEQLYCPWNYAIQAWCAHPDEGGYAPMGVGRTAQQCPYWSEKAECWRRYHADPDAPRVTV